MAASGPSPRPVEAWHVTRTLRSLEALAIKPRSAPELAAAVGVNPRTARRILSRLADEGYVEPVGDRRRRWRVTLRVVALAGQMVEQAELPRIALPRVSALHAELGESCHLCVPSYLSALCLVHVAGAGADCVGPRLRELVPAHATATGKALLAWRDDWREAVLEHDLAAYTPRTLTGPEYLRRELRRTEARGYAVEDREYQPDTRGLAVPVLGGFDQAVAAVAVTAPAGRLPVERDAERVEIVGRAAQAISAALR